MHLVVGSSGSLVLHGALWCVLCGGLLPVVTNGSYPHIAPGGRAQGARAFYRVRICSYRVLRILHISYALSVRNTCVLRLMRLVHTRGGPVCIRPWHTGTPYIPYLSTTWGPTNPHITGRQLKYVILALCSIYVTHPPIILSCFFVERVGGTFSRVAFRGYFPNLSFVSRGTGCVLCTFGFAHLRYTYGLFGNNCTILVL